MREEINNLKNLALSRIMESGSVSELEEIRIEYLGKKGRLNKIIKNINRLDNEDKKQVGQLINEAKDTVTQAISERKNKLRDSSREWFDATIPGKKPQTGSLHLITRAIEEISEIFENIGFSRVRYPEVEWDWFAFGGLNFGPWHPARDEWETFTIDHKEHPKWGPMVLTPHTSSGQLREMKRIGKPPIRMIDIGKCYRRQSDASHFPMFHQFEGLVVDENVSIAHLKGTLNHFARQFYGREVVSRLRPYNFPFTEPSFEVDFTCMICKGQGCKVCREGWLEIGGAGMVHPEVLKNGGIDPKKYSGFAFGWGVERAMMMKPGLEIDDLRSLFSSDLRYLKQF